MSTVINPRGADIGRPGAFAPTRPAGGVGVPVTHQVGARRNRLESLIIFLLFGVAFGLLGYWLVVEDKIVTFDSVNRLSGAYLTWHGSPPKLAAIGFSVPPLQTIVLLPFTIISSMATSLLALVIASALFGGLTMVALNRLLDRCDMSAMLRYPILVLTALVPTIAFYSADGGAEMISVFLLTAGVGALIAWFRTVDTRFLISSGMALGLAVLADYSDVLWLLLATAMVATVLARHGADDAEIEGSIITYVAPTFYALVLWCLINWLIVSSPFGWIDQSVGSTVNVATSHLPVHAAAVAKALLYSLRLALDAAPLSLVVAPLLVIVAIVQRNEMAGWLAAFTIVAIFRPGAEAILHANIADVQMGLSAPQMFMAIAGMAWLYQSFPDARALIGGALLIGLIVSIIVVWNGIATYPYQNMEAAFHTAVANTASTPTTSRGGYSVGVEREQQMADYIRAHVHRPKSILTDNSQTYAVILMTDKPSLFRTRLDPGGSGSWLTDVKTPSRTVKYFLVDYGDPSDAIQSAYPNAIKGQRSGVSVVYKNGRYALLAVAPGTTEKNSTAVGRRLSQSQSVVAVNSF